MSLRGHSQLSLKGYDDQQRILITGRKQMSLVSQKRVRKSILGTTGL